MMKNNDQYDTPWAERYASMEMLDLLSPQVRYSTWRKMWTWLAESQQTVGLPISNEQITEMREQIENIDFQVVRSYEKKLKHDVMAHIHAFGDVAPNAKAIIHLGATSADITDNADLIIFRKGLKIINIKIARLLFSMQKRAERYYNMPCLSFTHLQPAQLTTLGKRITMWMQPLLENLREIERLIEILPFRGIKGATGSADTFHSLLNGKYDLYHKIESICAQKAEFQTIQPITGQTYDRQWDSRLMGVMAQLAETIHKVATDIRLLQSMHEIEEPFSEQQVGSSAMAYKRNPIKSERACSIAKFVMSLFANTQMVAATQWLERSLDDSANRRISIPQALLGADSMLSIMIHIFDGLLVYPKVIKNNVKRELPFLISERIMMHAVQHGADRQDTHEILRSISMTVIRAQKEEDIPVDFVELVCKEKSLKVDKALLNALMDPLKLIGFADVQTNTFLKQHIDPILSRYEPLMKNIAIDLI
ncbi:MAG: adenylosuccinate lyase [Spirochaetia bacterium]